MINEKKERGMSKNSMNWSKASKLLLKIENTWSDDKSDLWFKNMKMWRKIWQKWKRSMENDSNIKIGDKNTL